MHLYLPCLAILLSHFLLLTFSSPLAQDSRQSKVHPVYNRDASQPFAQGSTMRAGEVLDDKGSNACDGIYGVRRGGDLPFNRANRGNLMFFGKGEQNTPDGVSDKWLDAGGVDDPKQSACGIPNNAYYISHVAIHPYWLKYAPLDRYCMPDVCISFWTADWKTDMMLKVTDICSTDPSKPNACKKPGDIKIDRTKAKIWSLQGTDPRPAEQIPGLGGDSFAQETVWFFRKCWDDGILQDAYDHESNWFAKPKYYNNKDQTGDYDSGQYFVNQAVYPAGLQYNQCGYNTSCQGDPIPDWKPSDPDPAWEPICGGQGHSGKAAASTQNCPDYSQLGKGGTPDTSQSAVDTAACQAVGKEFQGKPSGAGTYGGNGGLLNGSGGGGGGLGVGSGTNTTGPARPTGSGSARQCRLRTARLKA